MTDLTVVILTKNEEKNLRKCVESFRGVAKRFVIVDSFSTDSTEALCKELNAELQKIGSRLDFYQNKWVSYADQLNWGLRNTDIDTEWSMTIHNGKKQYPVLQDNIYIAPGAIIIGDITVGSDVAIGSNSVLTKSVEDYSVVVGIPGKVISKKGSREYVSNRI